MGRARATKPQPVRDSRYHGGFLIGVTLLVLLFQLVVIHRGGKTIYAYGAIESAPSGDPGVVTSAATVYAPAPVTVTAPPPSSTDSSGTSQTGP